jgi:hypothetical protein
MSSALASQRPGDALTFVCCIEAGRLESMTLLLVESIRRFGGRAASAPILAIQPRSGPALRRATRQLLADHGVDFHRLAGDREYSWYHFLNKPLSLGKAEQLTGSDVLAFLDSDTLVLAEPGELFLDPEIDFAARPESGSIESHGHGDEYDALWKGFAQVLGMDLDNLPWLTSLPTGQRTRFYFNSGVFAYRRATGLGGQYLATTRALLDGRISCSRSGVHWIEQAALALAAARLELRWRKLAPGYNVGLHGWGKGFRSPPEDPELRVLHYHNAMEKPTWADFRSWAGRRSPEMGEWLGDKGPITDPSGWRARLEAWALRVRRRRRRQRFLEQCKAL